MVNNSDEAPVAELIAKIIRDYRAEILGLYDELLMRASGWSISGAASQHLHRQAVAVLEDLWEQLAAVPPGPARDRTPAPVARPPEELPPREALRAAGALSEAVLTTVVDRLPQRVDLAAGVVRLAVALQQSVTDRLATGSVAYLGYLLEQLHRSHADERRRVARELHDLVAHSVAVALQNLELYAVQRVTRPDWAGRRLEIALSTLRDALDTLRTVAQDLRRSGAEDGLESALQASINDAVTAGTDVVFRFDGDEEQVAPPVRGELFLILREAFHNALAHAGAGRIEIDVQIAVETIRAGVVDNGRGFTPTGSAAGTGFASMRERAALLGGVVEVLSAPGRGTAVRVEIPRRSYDDNTS
jgi:signal transduction histidine kinase